MYRLKKDKQFKQIFEQGQKVIAPAFVVLYLKNDIQDTGLGFITSKKLGKAVRRNRIRRRLKELFRLTNLPVGYDFIVIGRNRAFYQDFHEMQKDLENLLKDVNK